MGWLIGFLLGLITDIARSVFIPASTEWINRRIPWMNKNINIKENSLILDMRAKLIAQGLDPDLVRYMLKDADEFLNRLSGQSEAFVENAVKVVSMITQAEMNSDAAARAEVATLQMERAIEALEQSGLLTETQLAALKASQAHWNAYAKAQAEFAAAEFEGGSMSPLIYSGELESVTISRTGDLKRILEELRERHV
ncbi:lysozyme inhibitor LprI family protein [Brucella sp. 22210]|uniref:lysozyme inhibitor LprI family protein n=1 Tax=Brucella sp. 22210 TaxID=3453892 RepID=UPI003F833E4D